jgi:hypothetical protein
MGPDWIGQHGKPTSNGATVNTVHTHLSSGHCPKSITLAYQAVHGLDPLSYGAIPDPIHFDGPPTPAYSRFTYPLAEADHGFLLGRHELPAVHAGPEIVCADVPVLPSCEEVRHARCGCDGVHGRGEGDAHDRFDGEGGRRGGPCRGEDGTSDEMGRLW